MTKIRALLDWFHAWRKSTSLSARALRTGAQVFVGAWAALGGAWDHLGEAELWRGTGAGVLLFVLLAVSRGDDGADFLPAPDEG